MGLGLGSSNVRLACPSLPVPQTRHKIYYLETNLVGTLPTSNYLHQDTMGCCVSRGAVFPAADKISHDTSVLVIERCPGHKLNTRARRFRGSLAVTDQRIVLYNGKGNQEIHVLFMDPSISNMEFAALQRGGKQVLVIRTPFHPDGKMRGHVEYRLVTDKAADIVERVQRNMKRSGTG